MSSFNQIDVAQAERQRRSQVGRTIVWGLKIRRMEIIDSLTRSRKIMWSDFELLASVYVARIIVWCELWRRRRADTTRRPALDRRDTLDNAVAEELRLAKERGLRIEQERYFAEIKKSRPKDK